MHEPTSPYFKAFMIWFAFYCFMHAMLRFTIMCIVFTLAPHRA